jgi:hypothetical protein
MRSRDASYGLISLSLASIGLLAFAANWLCVWLARSWFQPRMFFALYILALILELIALAFSRGDEQTNLGRLGAMLALLSLVLFVGACCVMFTMLPIGSTGVHG